MKSFVVPILLAGLGLAGCKSIAYTISAGSVQGYGPTAVLRPDGTGQASLGAIVADAVIVPAVDPNTGAPILVSGPCGGQNALSTFGSINGAVSAGAAATDAKPGVSASLGRGLASGEAGDLMALSVYQQAAGASIDAMAQWRDCNHAAAPAQAAASATPTAAPAATSGAASTTLEPASNGAAATP